MIKALEGSISEFLRNNNIKIVRERLEDMDPDDLFYNEDSFEEPVDMEDLVENILTMLPEKYSCGVQRFGDGTWSDYVIPIRIIDGRSYCSLFTGVERSKKTCDYPIDMLVFSLPEWEPHLELLSVAMNEDNGLIGHTVVEKTISAEDLTTIYEAMDTTDEELKDELMAYLINYEYLDLSETSFPGRTTYESVFGREAFNKTIAAKREKIAKLDRILKDLGYTTTADVRARRVIQECIDGTVVVNNRLYGIDGFNLAVDLENETVKKVFYVDNHVNTTEGIYSMSPYTEEGLKLFVQAASMALELDPAKIKGTLQDRKFKNQIRNIVRFEATIDVQDAYKFMCMDHCRWVPVEDVNRGETMTIPLTKLITKDKYELEMSEGLEY